MAELPIIWNCSSGPSSDRLQASELEAKFAAHRLECRLYALKEGEDPRERAAQLREAGHPVIVAAGGDGTIGSVASVLAETETTMGVLPLGTLNHFARDAGIPLELEAAIEVLKNGQVKAVDVAEVNGHRFINNSSIGIYPNMVVLREQEQHRGRAKWSAFIVAIAAVLRRFPLWNVRVSVEGKTITRTTSFVFVGNNEYEIEGLSIGQRQAVNTGRLFVYAARRTTRLGFLGMAIRALLGHLDKTASVEMWSVENLRIETKQRQVRVSTDGEVTMMTSPLEYRVHHHALKVLTR